MYYLLFAAFSFGQLGRIGFLAGQVNLYIYEILMAVLVLYYLKEYGFTPILTLAKKLKSVVAFLVISAISLIASSFQFSSLDNLVALLYLLRLVLYVAFFVYLEHHHEKRAASLKNLDKAVWAYIIITGIVAVGQYILYPNLRNLSYLGWDPHHYRVFGLYFDTGVAAAMFGLILMYLTFRRIYRGRRVGLWFFYLILMLLTYSRGLYVSLFSVWGFYLAARRKLLFMTIGILVFSGLLAILPRPGGEGVRLFRTVSIESRLEDYKQGITLWQNAPIIGIGYNHIRGIKDNPLSHSGGSYHSSFLTILVTTGLVGLTVFLIVLWHFASMGVYAKYIVIFISVFSLFDNILLHPFILFFAPIIVMLTRARTLLSK